MKTASEFIAFFEAIPEEKWCTGKYHSGDAHCAYGHLGVQSSGTPESRSLADLFGTTAHTVAGVNDGTDHSFPQPTPKQRILAALREIEGKV